MKTLPPTLLRKLRARLRRPVLALLPALLVACGGGGGNTVPEPFSCDVADQKTWLRDFFGQWYFWYKLAPSPDPAPYAALDDYFNALLYSGTDPAFPSDRWSNYESTESFDRFYGDGQSLGYGMAVAGVEVRGLPDEPLYVRQVEPMSSAAAQGVKRGDRVMALNGRAAAELIAADDFSLLVPARAGEQLTVDLQTAGGARQVVLTGGVFALTPVPVRTVFTTPLGRKVGYLMLNNMISQAEGPLEAAFQQFRAEGAQELVIDLRYNGGGLVSVATTAASYVAGASVAGQTFSNLLYNDKRAESNNQAFLFRNLGPAIHASRVYVLAGPRTCSASEQLINGLRPYVEVIVVGDTSCGKPVGFLPQPSCGNTYSTVNFEAVNANFEGRYWDGLQASCRVAESYQQALGSPTEPLLQVAAEHVDRGSCPAALAASGRKQPLRLLAPRERRAEAGERQGMIPR